MFSTGESECQARVGKTFRDGARNTRHGSLAGHPLRPTGPTGFYGAGEKKFLILTIGNPDSEG